MYLSILAWESSIRASIWVQAFEHLSVYILWRCRGNTTGGFDLWESWIENIFPWKWVFWDRSIALVTIAIRVFGHCSPAIAAPATQKQALGGLVGIAQGTGAAWAESSIPSASSGSAAGALRFRRHIPLTSQCISTFCWGIGEFVSVASSGTWASRPHPFCSALSLVTRGWWSCWCHREESWEYQTRQGKVGILPGLSTSVSFLDGTGLLHLSQQSFTVSDAPCASRLTVSL